MKELKKINPETLIQSVVEIRLLSKAPNEVILGMIYQEMRKSFPESIKSDVLRIPEEIRNKDENLKYQPHLTIFNDAVSLGISPTVLTFNCINEYIGWEKYFEIIGEGVKRIEKLDAYSQVVRIGLRYISFFENVQDVYEHVNIVVKFDEQKYPLTQTALQTRFPVNGAECNLQLNNKVQLVRNDKVLNGSIVDIDVYFQEPFEFLSDKLLKIIDNLHAEEKKVFQDLLTQDFLNRYKPEFYE